MGEYDRGNLFVLSVTPCVGVWIEMLEWKYIEPEEASLPVWECGLKLGSRVFRAKLGRHSLCGSVD